MTIRIRSALGKGVQDLISTLVCHSYFLEFDEKQRQRAKPYPPLATIQVAALLREAGYRVTLFDAMLRQGVESFAADLHRVRPQCVMIYEDNYNFLSKMCLGKMRAACQQMIRFSRDAGARVIVAGSDASDAPESYIEAGAEAVLLGEGLGALLAMLERLDGNIDIDTRELVAGLSAVATVYDGKLRRAKAGAPLPVPALPQRPAWDLVDIERYRNVWVKTHGYFSLNMAASRGCSFRCSWCAKPIWGDRYLQRAARDVASEMVYLKTEFGADHVWFADDIFGFRAAWVDEFADELAAGSGGMPFTIQLRADLVSERMAAALKRAGCREVWIGAESGSQKILDAMNKGTTVALIEQARRLLGEHEVRVGFFLMLGYLGEGFQDLLATRDLLERTQPDDVGVSVAYPLPGTKFHAAVQRQLGEQRNWQESKDLSMMFAGTYRSEFYRTIRDLLHDQVDGGMTPALRKRWQQLQAEESTFRQVRSSGAARQFAAFPAS